MIQILPVNATKTLNQWFHDNPTFYDDMLTAGTIDEATIGLIHKFYGLRTLCDDENFTRFYERQLDLVLPRYNKLLRFENTEFDAMVNSYRERQVTGEGSEISVSSTDKTKSEQSTTNETATDIKTPDVTVTQGGSMEETRQFEEERTPNITVTDEGTDHIKTKGGVDHTKGGSIITSTDISNASVGKQNPQSISYAQTPVGQVPNLNWEYPSTQAQDKQTGTTTESYNNYVDRDEYDDYEVEHSREDREKTTTGNETKEGSDTKETQRNLTEHKSGTETDVTTSLKTGSLAESESTDSDGTKTTSDLIRERWTGRDNLTPQDALNSAMNYIKNSSAFVWLKEQLEVCFLSVYDI